MVGSWLVLRRRARLPADHDEPLLREVRRVGHQASRTPRREIAGEEKQVTSNEAWMAFCLAVSLITNIALTCMTLKLYTEFAKERFKKP